MATLSDLVINIEASTLQLRRELQRADASINRFAGQTDRHLQRIDTRFSRMTNAARGFGVAVAGLGLAAGARQVVRYADSYTLLQNQLRLVTTGTANLQRVTAQLHDIAGETGQAIDATATLFARMTRATQGAGVSQTELLGITKALAQATVISGASATEASAALMQLSQGLAAGALRGEEFNSISEQMPILLDAIARETGLARGALREFAAEGGITTETVINAVQGMADEWDTQFGSMNRTVSQAVTHLDNELGRLIGTTNDAAGGTSALAAAIDGLADAVGRLNQHGLPDWLDTLLTLEGSTWGTRIQVFRELSSVLDGIMGAFSSASAGAGSKARMLELVEADVQRFEQLSARMSDAQGQGGPVVVDIFGGQSRPAPVPDLKPLKDAERATAALSDRQKELASAYEAARRDMEALQQRRVETIDDLAHEVRGLSRLADAHQKGADAVRKVEIQLLKENAAREMGVALTSEHGRQIGRLIEARERELDRTAKIAEAQRDVADAVRKSAAEQEAAAERAAELMQQPFENALRGVQDSFTNFFEDVFSGGIDSFSELADSVKGIFIRLAAEIATMMVIQPVLSSMTGVMTGVSAAGGVGFGTQAYTPSAISNGVVTGGSPFFAGPQGGTSSNLSQALGGAAIGAGIGAIGSSAVGASGAGQTGATVGGAIGGAVGTIFGPVGTFVGGALGSLAGGLIGGLFGGEESDKGQGRTFNLASGDIEKFGLFGSKFSQENSDAADQFTDGAVQLARSIEELTGGRARGALELMVGNRDGLRLTRGGGPQQNFGGDQEAFTAAIVDAVRDSIKGVSGIDARVLRRADTSTAETLLADLQFAQQYEELINATTGAEAFQDQLFALRRQFGDARDDARRLGLSVAALDRAADEAVAALREQRRAQKSAFADQLRQFSVDSPREQLNLQLRELDRQFDGMRQTADDLGISIGRVNRAQSDAAEGLREQYRAAIEQQRAAFEQQRSTLDQRALGVDQFFDNLLSPLQAFQSELSFVGASPADSFALAQQEFDRVSRLAANDNFDAIQRLPELGRALIEQAGAFGASPLQAQLTGQVRGAIESVIEDQKQNQLDATRGLQSAIRRASDENVTTLRELIGAVNELKREYRKLRA